MISLSKLTYMRVHVALVSLRFVAISIRLMLYYHHYKQTKWSQTLKKYQT